MGKRLTVIEKDDVVIRFSGDSGDGMQLTGTLFFGDLGVVRERHFNLS